LINDLEGTGNAFKSDVNSWTMSTKYYLWTDKWYECGGVILMGGYETLGNAFGQKNDYFERQYTGLGSHNQIYLEYTIYPIDSWVKFFCIINPLINFYISQFLIDSHNKIN